MSSLPRNHPLRYWGGATRLKSFREEKGLTPETLAQRARVPLAQLQQWEDGTAAPSEAEATRLVGVLWLDLDYRTDRPSRKERRDAALKQAGEEQP